MFKRLAIKFLFIVLSILILAASVSAETLTGNFFDNFSTDSGLWEYVTKTGTPMPVRNNDEGFVELTDAITGSNASAIWLMKEVNSPFTAEFKYMAGNGTGADGFTFMFNKNKAYEPQNGQGLGFNNVDGASVAGYGIEFDSWYNADNGDISGKHVALIQNNTNNHLQSVNFFQVEDYIWHNVKVEVGASSIKVWVDENIVIDWAGSIDRTYSNLGFSASTGGATNRHLIDDVNITPTDDIAPDTQITSGPTGIINTNSATFDFTGSDNFGTDALTYSYQLDNRAWSAYSTIKRADLRDLNIGAHTFNVRAKDTFGNIDLSPASRSFTYTEQQKTILSVFLLSANPKAVKSGKAATIKGQLKDASGQPVVNKQVLIKQKVQKTTKKKVKKGKKTIIKTTKKWIWKTIAKVETDANGNFKHKVKPKQTTQYKAEFAGDSSYLAKSSNIAQVTVNKAKKKK